MALRFLDRYSRDDSEFDRAIAFIDATFAVALTLLVTTLDISGNRADWDNLGDVYDSLGSQILTFAIAFVVIAGFWLAHFRMVTAFGAIDMRSIVLNLFLLATVVLIPFTTETAGNPDINELPLPTVVLAVNVAAVSIAFTLIYVMARQRGLLRTDLSKRAFRWSALMYLAPAIVFLASIPIAYATDPGYAQLFWISLAFMNPLIGWLATRDLRTHGEPLAPDGANV